MPVEATEHFYEDGLLVGSITTRESEWDSEQVDLLIAYDLYRKDFGSHGEKLSEATDPRADPNDYSPGSWRYITHGPFLNQAEKAHADTVDAYKRTAGEGANLHGMYWTVEKVDKSAPAS